VDLRDGAVDLCEVEDVEEVASPILGAKTLLVGLSSTFNADVMLFELSGVPRVLWSFAWRLGDGSKGAARLDNVEVDVLLVVVGLLLRRVGRAWGCWCGGRKICIGFCI
jgi:hypothetical protein